MLSYALVEKFVVACGILRRLTKIGRGTAVMIVVLLLVSPVSSWENLLLHGT